MTSSGLGPVLAFPDEEVFKMLLAFFETWQWILIIGLVVVVIVLWIIRQKQMSQ